MVTCCIGQEPNTQPYSLIGMKSIDNIGVVGMKNVDVDMMPEVATALALSSTIVHYR